MILQSDTTLCLTLCVPMNCCTPTFPVLHYLPSLLRLMSIELVMPSNRLILCHPLLILPSIFPSIKVFSSSQFFASGGQSIDIYLIELYGGINDPFIKILFFWCIAGSFYIVGKNRKRKLSLTNHFPYTWFLNNLWASLRISGPQLGIHIKRKC